MTQPTHILATEFSTGTPGTILASGTESECQELLTVYRTAFNRDSVNTFAIADFPPAMRNIELLRRGWRVYDVDPTSNHSPEISDRLPYPFVNEVWMTRGMEIYAFVVVSAVTRESAVAYAQFARQYIADVRGWPDREEFDTYGEPNVQLKAFLDNRIPTYLDWAADNGVRL